MSNNIKLLLAAMAGVIFWAIYYRVMIAPWCPAMWAGTAPFVFILAGGSFAYKLLGFFLPDDDAIPSRPELNQAIDSSAKNASTNVKRIWGALVAVCVVYILFQMTVGKLMERNIDKFGEQLALQPADALGQKGTIETRSGEICKMLVENGRGNLLARAFFPFAAERADVLRQSYNFQVMPDEFGIKKCRGRGHTNILAVRTTASP